MKYLRHSSRSAGYSLIELLFVISIAATLAGVAVPITSDTIDNIRAAGAARHVAARVASIRLDAVRRSSMVALRFEQEGSDYAFMPVLDGNGNGVRAADINAGIDRAIGRPERLSEFFANVSFGLLPGIPDIDGGTGNPDGVRIGSSSFLSAAPNGSCTGGTLYVHGRRTQYAVRVLGATGRTRFYSYDEGAGRWTTR
jgi:prepilin-type N-terminal cleavage/methylation domain-containing protein